MKFETSGQLIDQLRDQIDQRESMIETIIGGAEIAKYSWDDDDTYMLFCHTCEKYLYDEKELIDIPLHPVLCASCRMSDDDKAKMKKLEIHRAKERLEKATEQYENLIEGEK